MKEKVIYATSRYMVAMDFFTALNFLIVFFLISTVKICWEKNEGEMVKAWQYIYSHRLLGRLSR